MDNRERTLQRYFSALRDEPAISNEELWSIIEDDGGNETGRSTDAGETRSRRGRGGIVAVGLIVAAIGATLWIAADGERQTVTPAQVDRAVHSAPSPKAAPAITRTSTSDTVGFVPSTPTPRAASHPFRLLTSKPLLSTISNLQPGPPLAAKIGEELVPPVEMGMSWGYRFNPGQTFRYRYMWRHEDSTWFNSYEITNEYLLEVESVDVSGNATVMITSTRWRCRGTDSRRPNACGDRATPTSKSRVVVSPTGAFISGAIIEDDPQRTELKRRKKVDPSAQIWMESDSALLHGDVTDLFFQFPARRRIVVGDAWADTVVEARSAVRFDMEAKNAQSTVSVSPEDSRSAMNIGSDGARGSTSEHSQETRYMSSYVVQGIVTHGGVECIKLLHRLHGQQDLFEEMYEWWEETEYLIRTSDGALVEKRMKSRSPKNRWYGYHSLELVSKE